MSAVQNISVPITAPAQKSARLLWLAGTLALVALSFGARLWWRSLHYVETDDAFVTGHVHTISPRINGVVSRVDVVDNQLVRKGDLIAELDPTDQRIKIEQIQAQIVSAERQVLRDDALAAEMRAQAEAAGALVQQAKALLKRANQDAERYTRLYAVQMKAVAKAEVDAVMAAQGSAAADLNARRDAFQAAAAQTESALANRTSWRRAKRAQSWRA